ncbi:MAG TPA: hypothetical protein VGJ84_02720, partial [Polyangiaceae bacterium]
MKNSMERGERAFWRRSWAGWICAVAALFGLPDCGSKGTVLRGGNANGGASNGGTGTGTGANGFGNSGNFMSWTGGGGNGGVGTGATGTGVGGGISISLEGGVTVDGGYVGSVTLTCTPGSLVVSGAPQTVQCSVALDGGVRAVDVVWLVDDTRIGSIGQDGVFRANGFVGGVVKVTAKVGTNAGGSATITTSITVDLQIQNNVGGISGADIAKMAGGGSADGQFGWLYPYDKTVFPRGLQPPELQFKGGCADATYLKITLPHYQYEQASQGSSPLRISIPDPIWKGLTLSTTGADAVQVSVSKMCGGQVTGAITEQWGIAPQKLKGVVYYATYESGSLGLANGGMVRLHLGGQSEKLLGGCFICHSASGNGEVIGPTDENVTNTYDVSSGTGAPSRMASWDYAVMNFYPGLTFDGKRILSSGG